MTSDKHHPAVSKRAQTYEWALEAMQTPSNGIKLSDIAKKHRTTELYEAAVRNGKCSLCEIPEELVTYDLCREAVRQNYRELAHVPDKFAVYDLLLYAVSCDPEAYNIAKYRLTQKKPNEQGYTHEEVRLAMEAICPTHFGNTRINGLCTTPELTSEEKRKQYIAEHYGIFHVSIPRPILLDALTLLCKQSSQTARVDADEDKDDKVAVFFHLTRTRPAENEVWTDSLFLMLDKEEFEQHTKQEWEDSEFLVAFIKQKAGLWLSTPDGWVSIVQACQDYNWGDFIMDLPMPSAGIYYDLEAVKGCSVAASCDILVNQDEHIAPSYVSATLHLMKGEEEIGAFPVKVDFQDGCLYDKHGFDSTLLAQATEGFVELPEGHTIPCDPREEFMRLMTDLAVLQPNR